MLRSAAKVLTRRAGTRVSSVPRAGFSGFAEKERGEEARFFARDDAEKLAAMKSKFEAVVAKGDAEELDELMDVLEVEKKPETVLSKLGLDDWKFALPVGMFIGIPTLANEVLVLDAETQLVACFCLFSATMYTQVGPMMASGLDDYRANVAETLKKVDESMLVDIKASLEANEKTLDMESDIKSLHTLVDDMAVAKADALNYEEEHKYRASVVQKLESLVAIEESAVNAMKMRMMSDVKANVVESFSKPANKAKALDAAMAVLTSGKDGKMGTDVVGQAYGAALKTYREAYSKQAPGSDAILNQLEKDIAAAVAAPTVSAEGGNVYEKFSFK